MATSRGGLCTDEEFIDLFERYGDRASQHLNCTVRAVYARRRAVEKRIGRELIPGISILQERSISAKAMLTAQVENGTVLIGSDCHYWGHISTAHVAFLEFIKRFKPRIVVLNGDVLDGGRISRHPPIGWEGTPTVLEELRYCQARLREIEKAAKGARLVWPAGNHCLDPQTELLTNRGWVTHDDIRETDEILSYTQNGLVWTGIDEIIRKRHEGELVRVESQGMSMAVTPEHRVLGLQLNWKTRRYDRLGYHRADSLPYSMNIPVSGLVGNEGYPLSDNQIRLAGWILTDGHHGSNRTTIYQSKPKGVEQIRTLLSEMNIGHTERRRSRDITHVCGRALLKPALDAFEFCIAASAYREIVEWLPSSTDMPSWAHILSDRQFDIFLDTIIDGDGTRNAKGSGAVIYKQKPFLDALQSIAVQHGYRARIHEDPRGDYRLWVVKAPNIRIEKKHVFREAYSGDVWCLRVPHTNFMVRRRGTVYFTGNCLRFESRLAQAAPEFEGIEGFHLKDHFPRWEPCWGIDINEKVVIKHRFKNGIHATHNNTIWAGRTMVTGHLHSLKVTPFSDYNGTRWGVDSGTMAEPYGPQFLDYTEANPLNWRSGFVMLTFRDGKLLWPELVAVHDKGVIDFRGELIHV